MICFFWNLSKSADLSQNFKRQKTKGLQTKQKKLEFFCFKMTFFFLVIMILIEVAC